MSVRVTANSPAGQLFGELLEVFAQAKRLYPNLTKEHFMAVVREHVVPPVTVESAVAAVWHVLDLTYQLHDDLLDVYRQAQLANPALTKEQFIGAVRAVTDRVRKQTALSAIVDSVWRELRYRGLYRIG